jgi:hypothetical protein
MYAQATTITLKPNRPLVGGRTAPFSITFDVGLYSVALGVHKRDHQPSQRSHILRCSKIVSDQVI